MTLSVTHTFQSAIADDPVALAAGEVCPQSHWNATHTISGTLPAANVAAGGSTTDVQVNSSGVLYGDSNLTFTESGTSGVLTIGSGSYGLPITSPSSDSNTIGQSIAIGQNALAFQPASALYNNIAIGVNTMASSLMTTTAANNIAIGPAALNSLTSGYDNVGIGTAALTSTTTGSENFALGYAALQNNTTGGQNVGIGVEALYYNQTSAGNVAIGFDALFNCVGTAGTGLNTAIGYLALTALTTGYENTAIGYNAGSAITTGLGNTIIGNYAGTTALTEAIALADGVGNLRYDYGVTTASTTTISSALTVTTGTCSAPSFTPKAFGPILPSSIYLGGASGNLFPNFYIPANNAGGGGAIEGIGVVASLAADAAAVLQFNMPEVIPSGTLKLRILTWADVASSTVGKVTISDGATSPGSNIGATSLNGETQTSVTVATADLMYETKVSLTTAPTANQILTVLATFNHTNWTLAVTSTWAFSVVWE